MLDGDFSEKIGQKLNGYVSPCVRLGGVARAYVKFHVNLGGTSPQPSKPSRAEGRVHLACARS